MDRPLVIIETLGKSPGINRLVEAERIDVADLAGKWESFLIEGGFRSLPGNSASLVGARQRPSGHGLRGV